MKTLEWTEIAVNWCEGCASENISDDFPLCPCCCEMIEKSIRYRHAALDELLDPHTIKEIKHYYGNTK